jgi:two-component system chemotaxis response regulator CheB
VNASTLRGLRAIAIGGSAGAIEVLQELLPALPAACRLAVLVVLHQPRDRASLLAELFASRTPLKVCEPDDKQDIEDGCVYFAPSDYHLLVDAGPRISLSADEPVHFSRPAIDVLFESAAETYGPALLAIVLSGGNEDGAAGALAVRRAGGRVIVQDPAQARVAMMPRSAIERCAPDAVLDVAAIAALFRSLARTEAAQHA